MRLVKKTNQPVSCVGFAFGTDGKLGEDPHIESRVDINPRIR